jgi:hypothetical protein
MTSSSAMQGRMAALFLLAVGLIAWQAPLTRPTVPASTVRATRPGEQLYPIAVPDAAPIPLPARFTEAVPEAAAPARPAVAWTPGAGPAAAAATPPPGTCDLLLRVSRYHWARRAMAPGELSRLAGAAAGSKPRQTYRLAARDFADDDDGDGDPIDPGELRPDPPGAEAEVFCSPLPAPTGGARP